MVSYPTEEQLKVFEQWQLENYNINTPSITKLVNYIESLWQYKEWGFRLEKTKKTVKLELHTGGWSGNEDIIEELKKTILWQLFWQKSTRGGHYWFKIPLEFWKMNEKGCLKLIEIIPYIKLEK